MSETNGAYLATRKILLSLACMLMCTPPLLADTSLSVDYLDVLDTANFYGNVRIQQGYAPTNGLKLYYSCNVSNSTAVIDDSGNGYTGTVSGATWTPEGIAGGAYSFDGSDWIGIPAITVSGATTYGGWAKLNAWWEEYDCLLGTDGGNDYPLLLDAQDQGVYAGETSQQGWSYSFDGEWHQYYMVYDGSGNTELFIDGVSQGSKAYAPTGFKFIGVCCTSKNFYMNGFVDEVRIYNRVLSTNEIFALYMNGRASTNDCLLTAESISLGGVVRTNWPGEFVGNATNITAGTLSDERLSANVTLLGQTIETAAIADSAITTQKLDLVAVDGRYVNAGGDTMTGTLVLPADGLVAGTDQLVVTGGNVGIGTGSPATKLHVAGDSKVDGGLTVLGAMQIVKQGDVDMGAYSNGLAISGTTSGSNLVMNGDIVLNGHWLSGDWNQGGVFITSGGHVGIGTSAPDEMLHVLGNVRVDGALNMNGNVISNLGANAISSNTIDWTSMPENTRWNGGSAGLDAATARTSLQLGTAALSNATAFAAGTHSHSATEITTGTLSTDRLDSSVSLLGQSIGSAEIDNSAVTTQKLDMAALDTRYVNTSGDTMTGNINLGGKGITNGFGSFTGQLAAASFNATTTNGYAVNGTRGLLFFWRNRSSLTAYDITSGDSSRDLSVTNAYTALSMTNYGVPATAKGVLVDMWALSANNTSYLFAIRKTGNTNAWNYGGGFGTYCRILGSYGHDEGACELGTTACLDYFITTGPGTYIMNIKGWYE